MTIELKVPELPESISDAMVLTVHKKVGDFVALDEVIIDLETDKVVLEVPAFEAGIVTAIFIKEGDTVTADTLLATVDNLAKKPASASEPLNATLPVAPAIKQQDETVKNIAMGPAVRRLMQKHQLDAHLITGTGKSGRIVKSDILDYVAKQKQRQLDDLQQSTRFEASNKSKTDTQPENNIINTDNREQKRMPMTRLRSKIAERLLSVSQNTAMLTTFNEVNLEKVIQLRKDYQEQFVKTFDIKLGFMSFFVKATCEALKRFPDINSSIDGSDIVYHGYCDIGVAVSTERGLVVPILKNAEHMSLSEIEKNIMAFAKKAQNNALSMDDITGGTFTITNGGVFGSLMSTPILNPPQSAILGMHSIQQRPIAEDGKVVIKPMMYLALSYDHQIIDGRSAVQFLKTIKDLLEDPARILLDV